MAETLNPHAPSFFPAPAAADSSLLTLRGNQPPPPLPPLLALLPSFHSPDQLHHQSISKGDFFLHPSLYYYHAPSHLLLPHITTHVSYFFPPTKYAPPAILESDPESGVQPSPGDLHEDKFCPLENEEQSKLVVADSRTDARSLPCRPWIRRSLGPRMCWVPKTFQENEKLPIAGNRFLLEDDFQFKDEADAAELASGGASTVRSTVMIKNIPNKLSKKLLLELLDDHCRRENQKIQEDATGAALTEYDFLYLPMDFISGNNLGYAFVNYTSPVAAKRLHCDLHMKSWSDFGSRKVCQVTYAKIQGLEELVKHFKHSVFTCTSADYLPVFFNPSRDGSRSSTEHMVGKLASSMSKRSLMRRKR